MSLDRPDRSPKHVSRVEERDRLLDEVMRQAETRDTEFRALTSEPPRRAHWASGVAALVLLLALQVSIAPPAFLAGEPLPTRTPADVRRGIEANLRLQAGEIEVFRVRQGRLPDGLEQVRTRLSDVRYVRSDARVYQLVTFDPDGEPVVYDSALPGGGLGDAPIP